MKRCGTESVLSLKVASNPVKANALHAKLHGSSVSVPAIVAFAKDAAKDGMQALAETLQLCY